MSRKWLADGLMTGYISIKDMADAIVARARAEGHERVILIGVSFGGAVAQQIAYDYPEFVEKLILISTCIGHGGYTGSPWAMWRLMLKSIIHAGRDGRVSVYEAWRRLIAIASWSSRRWVHEITVPTLVVHGDEDDLVPYANGQQLERLIPGARLVRITGGDHYALIMRAAEIGRAIEAFVAGRQVIAA
jgi:pimeloyl-ACP methyl ester carboxylesterase